MDMFEEARMLAVMMKMRSLSQSEVAKMLGVSQSYVANKLRLLKLDEATQKIITDKGLTERHARALLKIKDPEKQKCALDKICDRGLTVAESEALADMIKISEPQPVFEKGKRLKAIYSFLDSIKHSLNTIREMGAEASSKISYDKERIYISIYIDENSKF
ncbi:MAG: hypothetical protein IJX58_03080 [Clostridia bacterium]|nr:hypothetical protein [Clostridia bacterium]